MASKSNFVQLFLDKGEKFLLIGAGIVTALLMLLGVMALTGAIDPKKEASTLAQSASGMRSKMNSEEKPDNAPAMPEPPVAFQPIPYKDYQNDGVIYETTAWPSLRRQNPIALTPIDSQVDLILGSRIMLGRDFGSRKSGDEIKDFNMMIRDSRTKSSIDPNSVRGLFPKGIKKRTPPPVAVAPPSSGPGPGPGPGPGGMPGGIGGPGGMPGGSGGPGGMPGGSMGSMGGMPGGLGNPLAGGTKTTEMEIRWMKFSEWEKKPTGQPAFMVYPLRMAVVHMSFPLQKQLEEIRKALRLKSLATAIEEAGPALMMAKNPETGKPMRYADYVAMLGGKATMPASGLNQSGGMGGMPPMGGMMPPRSGSGMMPGMPGAPDGGNTPPRGLTLDSVVAAPVFAGFVVERRDVLRDGKVGPWVPFDHVENYAEDFEIYEAKTITEGGFMPNFLRPDIGQEMSFPLPELAKNWTSIPQGPLPPGMTVDKGKYPVEIRMPSIVLDWKGLEAANIKPIDPSKYITRLNSGGRKPINYGDSTSGTGGTTGIGDLGNLGTIAAAAQGDANKLPISHMLIRFMDTRLEPGASYQYRVKIRFRNPNYGKPEKMAIDQQALEEFIESSFYELNHGVKVPREDHMYAYSKPKYEEHVTEIVKPYVEAERDRNSNLLAAGQLKKLLHFEDVKQADPRSPRAAVIQMQRWLPEIRIGDNVEPVGGWVEAEIPVAVGEYIGRKVLLELPLWRANEDKYILSELPKAIITGWPRKEGSASPPPSMPAGRPVDFSTQHILLDFDGGRLNYRAGTNSAVVSDESTTEMLILREDGKIQVRREADDMVNKERVARNAGWNEWITKIRTESTAVAQPAGTGLPGAGSPGGGRGGN